MRTTTVYLYHFSRKLGHAGHYLGSCTDLEQRDSLHQSGHGARLLQVAKERGIVFWIVKTWRGGRQLERRPKNRHNAARLCPICQAKRRKSSIVSDVDFFDLDLVAVRSGQIQPVTTLVAEQLAAIEDEAIGQDVSERPYMY